MSNVNLKVGEWYEDRDGDRWNIVFELPPAVEAGQPFIGHKKDGYVTTFDAKGNYYEDGGGAGEDLIRHLPGCTGFDWVEPVAKFKVGDVVYATKPKNVPGPPETPCWMPEMDGYLGVPLKVTEVIWRADRKRIIAKRKEGSNWTWAFHPDWLSKEPLAAQYRPFANDEEYAPHFDRPVSRAYNGNENNKGAYRLAAFDEVGVWTIDNRTISYEQMFNDGRKFTDTNEPFGVRVQ